MTEDEDTPVLNTAIKWINKIHEKYGPEAQTYIKDLEEDEHDIWVVGPYMRKK